MLKNILNFKSQQRKDFQVFALSHKLLIKESPNALGNIGFQIKAVLATI